MENTGKPANVLDKIIEGKLGSFYSQFVLLDQPSVRDGAVTIAQLVAQASAKTGENIQISRFIRFRVGEGAEDAPEVERSTASSAAAVGRDGRPAGQLAWNRRSRAPTRQRLRRRGGRSSVTFVARAA